MYLAPEICKQIIEKFEINKDQQEETILKGHRSFKEIQLNKHEDWKPIVDGLYTTFKSRIGTYAKEVGITPVQWHNNTAFFNTYETLWSNDIDEFKEHVDVGDYAVARRFFVFFLYLDENKEGRLPFLILI